MSATTQQPQQDKLKLLARYSRQARERTQRHGMQSWSDDLSHLTDAKRASWRRILSSVATTESIEGTLIEPLLKAKKEDEDASEYLSNHAADERRHHALITAYLKNTFSFEKKSRTWSDRVLYDRVFPAVASVFRVKPLYGFALIYCYEKFSLVFYGKLRAEAQADGAQNLLSLIRAIEKDELRHVAGMEHCLRSEVQAKGGVSLADLSAVRGLLELMLLDVDMRPWAVHNSEVREHLRNLGFDTNELTQSARATARATLELMKKMGEEVRAC